MKIVRKVLVILLCSSALITSSCVYDTNDVFNNPTDDLPDPVLQSLSLDLAQDTLFVYSQTDFKYEFKCSNRPIVKVVFEMDSIPFHVMSINEGVLSINNKADGAFHTLTVKVYVKSQTGSIMDQLHLENYVFSKSWNVCMYSSGTEPLKSFYRNGFLTLEAPQYRGKDLKEYVLCKVAIGQYNTLAAGPTPVLSDSCYLGLGGSYVIRAVTTDNKYYTMASSLLASDPVVVRMDGESGNFRFHWKKPGYYASVKSTKLSVDGSLMATRTNPEDTLYSMGYTFGRKGTVSIQLNTSSQYYNQMQATASTSSSVDYVMGTSFGLDYGLMLPRQTGASEFLFQESGVAIGKYSTNGFTKIKTIPYPSSLGNSSNITTSVTGGTLSAKIGDRYVTLRLSDGVILTKTDYTAYMGTGYSPCPVSDGGFVLVSYSSGGAFVLDAATGSDYGRYAGSGVKGLDINAAGKYVLIQSDQVRLYSRQSDKTLSQVGSFGAPLNGTYYGFDPANSNQFVVWENNTFSVYSCADASLVRSFPLIGSNFLAVDTYANELLVANSQNLKICDYTTGAVLYQIPFYLPVVQKMTPGTFILVNGYLINRNGLYYKYR